MLHNSQIHAYQGPLAQVLVATSDEGAVVKRVELDGKDRREACVPEGYGPILLPLEDLNRETLVHAN